MFGFLRLVPSGKQEQNGGKVWVITCQAFGADNRRGYSSAFWAACFRLWVRVPRLYRVRPPTICICSPHRAAIPALHGLGDLKRNIFSNSSKDEGSRVPVSASRALWTSTWLLRNLAIPWFVAADSRLWLHDHMAIFPLHLCGHSVLCVCLSVSVSSPLIGTWSYWIKGPAVM